ncbi:hypothetical protein GO988_13470 [Hymenobacter sp. HMF4947]|uniref:YcxB family protein n=1 Tax=Hymenobacter ginkgonis TaxID=2682976 RepID=A0A7K1TG08_9BACT|nr:hypothetical protein [Hymenobacter ginkgonis]MVN77339.1 hypothetical protein [Hymenobacter ginkgonis]
MSQQILSKSERIRLFLREYYLGQTAWIKTVRLVGGPLIIGAGAEFYFNAHRSLVAYGGFCFLYGIYYTLKPLLIIAVRPALFQSLNFGVKIGVAELKFQEADAELVVQFKAFKSIRWQTGYYALKLPDKATIYLRTDQLTEEEKGLLNKHLIV